MLGGYLDHLRDHKGRRHSTLVRYRGLAELWIAPQLGSHIADRVVPDDIGRALGAMRAAGQSQSSIHQAFTLLNGTFKWARRNRAISRTPRPGNEMPASRVASTENPCVEADPAGEQVLATAVGSSMPGRAPRGLDRHPGTGDERRIASQP